MLCQLSMKYVHMSCLLLVPTGAPLEVEATSLSSTHLELQWLPPVPENQNGVITAYYINITELNTGTAFTFAVSGTTLFFSSSTFHPYYKYSCLIAAVTVGAGPAAHIEVTTREDGNNFTCLVNLAPYYVHLHMFLLSCCTQYLLLHHRM